MPSTTTFLPSYPTLPERKDRRRKIFRADAMRMRALRRSGWSLKRLAAKYHVTSTAILYHCDPAYRARTIASVGAANKHRYRTDSAWRAKQKAAVSENLTARSANDPTYRTYHLISRALSTLRTFAPHLLVPKAR